MSIRTTTTNCPRGHTIIITKDDEGRIEGTTGIEVVAPLPPETEHIVVACSECTRAATDVVAQPGWLD